MNKNPLRKLNDDNFESIALRFRALGEKSRLRLVEALHTGEKNVTELVKLTGLGQPNVSRHLNILVAAGLIGRRKEGLNVLYRIVDETLSEVCTIVCKSVANSSGSKR